MEHENISIRRVICSKAFAVFIEKEFKGVHKLCGLLILGYFNYNYPLNLFIALTLNAVFDVIKSTLIWILKIKEYFKEKPVYKSGKKKNYQVSRHNNELRREKKSQFWPSLKRNSKKNWKIVKTVAKWVEIFLGTSWWIIFALIKFICFILCYITGKLLDICEEEAVSFEHKIESDLFPQVDYGVPHLHAYDMTTSIGECTNKNKLRPPKNVTTFLKEIGYFHTSSRGYDRTFFNSFVSSLTKHLRQNISEIEAWKATPTTAQSIFTMVKSKIDRAPVEQHQHWNHLCKAYSILEKWMQLRKCELKRLSNDEVIKSLNLSSSMGMQEETIIDENGSFTFESVKDFVEFKLKNGEYLWQKRVKIFRNSLIEGKPILGVFNTVAKAEKKNKNLERANRLIWYLPATARVFEAQVFGGLEDCLKKLPYSVSGIPLYDYGELLADIMQQNNRKAICNDISGYDTRISYGLLCLEANFLRNLTKDESLKEDITNLYRLYANAHVMIARGGGIRDEIAIYKLRGQVASGRRTTYVMNTITNTVVSLCAAAYSYGIKGKDFDKWMLNCLFEGHTDDFGGKISGDDSVLIFGPKQAELYSKKAHKFLNEIGLIRKDLNLNENSHIIHNMEDITFCSNQFVKVKYSRNSIERWMPVKPVEDILGKASIMLEKPKDKGTEEAWARIQGLELLVYYHHIPEVRALALALLSCTSSEFSLESLSTGWKRLSETSLQEKDPLETINSCLFGKSTKIRKFRGSKEKIVKYWSDLGELDQQTRKRLGFICDEYRQDWYKSIPLIIQKLRKHNKHSYTDWNNNMYAIKNQGEILGILEGFWNRIRDLF